tara:strand:+ start:74 stop:280 length:207 start_codon:yes stop_codon:yes gene_type:complete
MHQAFFEFSFLNFHYGAIFRTKFHTIAEQLVKNEPSIPINTFFNILVLEGVVFTSLIDWNILDSLDVF